MRLASAHAHVAAAVPRRGRGRPPQPRRRWAAALAAICAALGAGCGGVGGGGGSAPIVGPPPGAEIVAERTLVKAGVAVAFALEVEGLAPETYAWDFGDGGAQEGEGLSSASHAFAVEGTYVVSGVAVDANGNSVAASVSVDVTPAGGPPVLTVDSVELHGTVLDATPCAVTVNGAGPVEVDGGAFTWQDALDESTEVYDVRAVDQGANATTRTVTVTFLD